MNKTTGRGRAKWTSEIVASYEPCITFPLLESYRINDLLTLPSASVHPSAAFSSLRGRRIRRGREGGQGSLQAGPFENGIAPLTSRFEYTRDRIHLTFICSRWICSTNEHSEGGVSNSSNYPGINLYIIYLTVTANFMLWRMRRVSWQRAAGPYILRCQHASLSTNLHPPSRLASSDTYHESEC